MRHPRRPSRVHLTSHRIRTKTLTTTSPRQKTPLPRVAAPPPDPTAAPEGDTRRVRGQDSGPRARGLPPAAQKRPRRRRRPHPGRSGPTGRRFPPALRRLPPHHRALPPRAPAQATGLTSPHSSIRRTPTADAENFLHYTSRRRTTQIEPRCRRTPATRRAPPNP